MFWELLLTTDDQMKKLWLSGSDSVSFFNTPAYSALRFSSLSGFFQIPSSSGSGHSTLPFSNQITQSLPSSSTHLFCQLFIRSPSIFLHLSL